MATFVEAIRLEESKPANTIRLIPAGKFLRAYNQSAWLFQCCIAEHSVMRKYVKALKRDVFFVGFPIEKLFDTVGERKTEKTEHGFDVELSPDEIPSPEAYEAWTQSVDAAAASKADYLALPLAGAAAEREVLRRLREWPIESKTLMENLKLLSDLRQLLCNK